MSDSAPLLHTVPDALRELGGIGRTKLYDLFQEKRIRPVKVGRRTLVPDSELRRFIAEQIEEPAS